MKAKKPLLLIPFVLLVIVLVLGVTGLAVAAPATAVKGTCESRGMDIYVVSFDPVSGDIVLAGWEEYWMTGDLVGNYREELTAYGNMYSPALQHVSVGRATFSGTLRGEGVSWSARLYSTGRSSPDMTAGKGHAKDTLISGMEGQITFHYSYGYGHDYYWYTGELK